MLQTIRCSEVSWYDMWQALIWSSSAKYTRRAKYEFSYRGDRYTVD